MTPKEIVDMLETQGYLVAEEYFPDSTNPPYVVVLTPSAVIDGADMYDKIIRKQTIRVELYTKNKSDTLREAFKQLMYTSGAADSYREEEGYTSAVRLFVTAIEFTVLLMDIYEG